MNLFGIIPTTFFSFNAFPMKATTNSLKIHLSKSTINPFVEILAGFKVLHHAVVIDRFI